MIRIRSLSLLLLLAACALPSPQEAAGAQEAAASDEVLATDKALARAPNVVVILVDDMGWTDLACYGSEYYETPTVDRLAREGMRFTQGYAACAVCSPTRAAILTGRYPARIGVTDWIHHHQAVAKETVTKGAYVPGFDPAGKRRMRTPRNHSFLAHEEVTIAELLKVKDYSSCHIGKWHLGPSGWLPGDQGFDQNVGGFQVGSPPSYFDPFTSKRFIHIPGLPSRKPGEYLTDREGDEAAAFIAANKDRPFFLYLSHYAVHSPLQGRKDLVEKYRAKPTTNQKVPVYAAMVESVDQAAQRVLDALDEHGLAENTIVVFTSDNGGAQHFPATNNAPLRKGKGYPYEGGHRVPWIVRWPGVVKPGSICDVPISSIDLLPTLAEAVGVPLPEGRVIDGASLMPLLRGEGGFEARDLVWHFPHYWWGTRIKPYSVLRSGNHKLIRFYEDDRRELYDLSSDLSEKHDLAKEQPELVKTLDARLTEQLAEQGALFPVKGG